MSLMAVGVVLIRGGANFGFIRFYFLDKDPEYRRRLVRTVFWAQMAYATVVLVFCVVFAQQIAVFLGHHGQAAQESGSARQRREPRHRDRRPPLGERQLRPDDESLPGREAIGRVHDRDAREHRHHRRADRALRRRRQQGPLGIIVGNLSGTLIVFGVLLAYRSRAARPPVGREAPAHDEQVRPAAHGERHSPMWVTNFGDRLMLQQAPPRPVRAHAARAVLARLKICSAMVLLFTAFQIAWPAFAYSIKDEGEAKRAYSYVLTYLLLIASWAAVGLSLFAPWIVRLLGKKPGLLAGGGCDPGACVRERLLRGLYRGDRSAPGGRGRPSTNWIAATLGARSSTSASTSSFIPPTGCSARRGRPWSHTRADDGDERGTRRRSTRRRTSGGGSRSSSSSPRCSPRPRRSSGTRSRSRSASRSSTRSSSRPSASTSRPSAGASGDCFLPAH